MVQFDNKGEISVTTWRFLSRSQGVLVEIAWVPPNETARERTRTPLRKTARQRTLAPFHPHGSLCSLCGELAGMRAVARREKERCWWKGWTNGRKGRKTEKRRKRRKKQGMEEAKKKKDCKGVAVDTRAVCSQDAKKMQRNKPKWSMGRNGQPNTSEFGWRQSRQCCEGSTTNRGKTSTAM